MGQPLVVDFSTGNVIISVDPNEVPPDAAEMHISMVLPYEKYLGSFKLVDGEWAFYEAEDKTWR